MAIDINEIRRKLEQISRGNKSSNNKFNRWKYEKPGEYKIRILPWRDADPGTPFPERIVYYGISGNGKGMIVSPENAGNVDPIKEFRIKLFNDAKEKKDDSIKDMAKKLSAKTITCVAIIDRNNEAAGPQLWSPNYTDAKALLSLFLSEAGDYIDLKQGRDVNLVVSSSKKINQNTGEPYLEAQISVSLSQTPATKDDATLEKWLNSMPNLNEYYPPMSTADTRAKLQEWLGGSSESPEGTAREGQSREDAPESRKSSLDSLATKISTKSDSKPTSSSSQASTKASPPVKSKKLLESVEDDLDAALDDLG